MACPLAKLINLMSQEPELSAYCRKAGIQLQAYAPAVRAKKADDPVLLKIAQQVDRAWNRVLLRWSWQRGQVQARSSPGRFG